MSTTLWLTLTIGSATNANDVLELEEMVQAVHTIDGYTLARYDGLLPVVQGKSLADAILNYLKQRIEERV